METQIASTLAQLGAAGLIGWMWLTERRASSQRDKQLTETHEKLMDERTGISVLVRVIEENAKALATLEASQRRLANVLDAIAIRKQSA